MRLNDLRFYCVKKIEEFPEKADTIREIFQLAKDEISEGGSEDHECELAVNDIDEELKK